MVHPTDSELLALIHEEQPTPTAVALRHHLASCQSCQLQYRTLVQEDGAAASLLTLLDTAVPQTSSAELARRARMRRRTRPMAAAAAAILIAATAAATVIPGAPFHRFFRTLVGTSAPQARPALRRVPVPADTAGVTVAAGAGVVIALRDAQTAGEIHLAWRPGTGAVSVRAIGGEVGYSVSAGKVLVENRRPALRYEIILPATVPSVTVKVGDRVLWQWQSSNLSGASRSRRPMTFDLSQPGRAKP